MSSFLIKSQWAKVAESPIDELKATHARLQIFVNNINITEHKAPRKQAEECLSVPVYYLAEWIAENWWVLLYEPTKDENNDDSEYYLRHSIISAQHGFPLPNLSIVPFGRSFRLNSNPRRPQFSNVAFTADAYCDAPRHEVEDTLAHFIASAVKRLRSLDIAGTPLEAAWTAIEALTDDERTFCEIIGALGLPPSAVTDDLADAVEQIYQVLGHQPARDFFLAATKDDVLQTIGGVKAINDYLNNLNGKGAGQLFDAKAPAENYHAPSWRRGMQAARVAREQFNVQPSDKNGADKIFERLQIDPSVTPHNSLNESLQVPFVGAVDRDDGLAKIALLQEEELHRRFSAARGTYLAWVSEAKSRRLVTNAVTRDQQASRSFAAEILIPQSQLKALAGPKRELHYDQVREVARQRRVMLDVVYKQAVNAGIRVGAM